MDQTQSLSIDHNNYTRRQTLSEWDDGADCPSLLSRLFWFLQRDHSFVILGFANVDDITTCDGSPDVLFDFVGAWRL